MDLLLYKTNKIHQKVKKELKRNANNLRWKQSRSEAVNFKRNIPQETNKEELDKVKPSRRFLLKQWKQQRDLQKQNERKKALFVVKHVVHNDEVYADLRKMDGTSKATLRNTKKNDKISPVQTDLQTTTTSSHRYPTRRGKVQRKQLSSNTSHLNMTVDTTDKNRKQTEDSHAQNGVKVTNQDGRHSEPLKEIKTFEAPNNFQFKFVKKKEVKNTTDDVWKTLSSPKSEFLSNTANCQTPSRSLNTPSKKIEEISLPRTPTFNTCVKSRVSLTPNPKNFLCKKEDPVAQRMDSPNLKPQSKITLNKNVQYFTELVDKEETKFRACTEKWTTILNESLAPDHIHGDILCAIGQANLFTKKRFKQFKELIDLHQDKTAEKEALLSDLEGFWDMIYFQVDDVFKRFAELDSLQGNNWVQVEPDPAIDVPKIEKKVTMKKSKSKELRIKAVKGSQFKKFRQQMKNEMKAHSEDTGDICLSKLRTAVNEVDLPNKQATGIPHAHETNEHSVAMTAPVPQSSSTEFQRYLIKTDSTPNSSLKRDLLSSFERTNQQPAENKECDDLMVFSPLVKSKAHS